MRTKRTQRQILVDCIDYAVELERAEMAVEMLERLDYPEARRAVNQLARLQQRLLKKHDAEATRLGAPYPWRGA